MSPALLSIVSSEAIGLGVAVLLLFALAVLLPTGTRARLRAPVVLAFAYALVVVLRHTVGPESIVGKALPVVGAFFLSAAIGQAAFLLLIDAILGGRLGRPLSRIFRDIVQVIVLVGVVLVTLRSAGVEPGSLLTTSALLTAVIGLSLQDTLGNLFAGLSIQAQRPFEVGDWIQIDPDPRLIGRVVEINWRATTVLTSEHVELIIPNGTLAKSALRNFTKPTGMSRRTVDVGAPYDVAPQRVEKAILEAVQGVEGVRRDPAPFVLLGKFADSSITYSLCFFINDFTLRDRVESVVRQRVWSSFRRAGISIPFPTRTIQSQELPADAQKKADSAEQAERLRAIRGVDFLSNLPEGALERLAALSKICHYLMGEVVIQQGEAGHELFIIRSGEVVVLLGRPRGSVAEIARLGAGKFFGEMSVMTGERRTATIQAVLDCELVRIDKEAFQEILAADPKLIEPITAVLVERQSAREENINARAARTRPDTDKEAKSSALIAAIRQFFSL